jgi:uncharacterized protein YbaP (TraB family)
MKVCNASVVALFAVVGGACHKPKADGAEPASQPAKSTDPWAKPATKLDPLPHPLFWSIEKDGKTSYALGTIHVGVDPETRLPPAVWTKLDSATSFAMETDLGDASSQDMLRHDGSSLHTDLGEPYWKKLETAIGPDVARRLDNTKPMVAMAMLSLRGLPETAPMDGVLSGRASNEHKHIVYLEPFQKQQKLLEKWMDANALKELLDDLPESEQLAKQMLAAYLAGDDAKILAINSKERDEYLHHGHTAAEYDQQMEEMLYARNASWIDAIEKLHAGGGGFIAVGAMHLVGPRSVLDLLRQKGFKVTRLTP